MQTPPPGSYYSKVSFLTYSKVSIRRKLQRPLKAVTGGEQEAATRHKVVSTQKYDSMRCCRVACRRVIVYVHSSRPVGQL